MAGATERVFVAPAIPTGGGKVIAAPFQFYTTGEDNLRIVSFNSLVGVTLKVQARLVNSKGELQAASWDHTPNSDRSAASTVFPLAAGSVLNLTVFANSGAPKVGQTFVIVQLIRGLGAAAIVLGTLIQGYVTSQQALAWPGSPCVSSTDGEPSVRAITGAQPAFGINITEVCPAGARWELMTLFCTLRTSAVAGTRNANILIVADSAIFGEYGDDVDVGASTPQSYNYVQGSVAFAIGVPRIAYFGLATRQFLRPGDAWQTTVFGFDPGDRWDAPRYLVREWLEAA